MVTSRLLSQLITIFLLFLSFKLVSPVVRAGFNLTVFLPLLPTR